MSQAADEDDALAFTDLRKRFEQLANGGGLPGPSRPSTVPSQWIAPRSSSDRVYDRIAPKSPSASRIATQSLTPPPTLSPRGRGFLNLDPTQINIDTGKVSDGPRKTSMAFDILLIFSGVESRDRSRGRDRLPRRLHNP
jgi:hypothetical protein